MISEQYMTVECITENVHWDIGDVAEALVCE